MDRGFMARGQLTVRFLISTVIPLLIVAFLLGLGLGFLIMASQLSSGLTTVDRSLKEDLSICQKPPQKRLGAKVFAELN
jgi:hypothetical protein